MANRILFEDNTQNGNQIEIDPAYMDHNDSQGVKLVLDIKGDKKYRGVHLSRQDAQQMIKWLIDILG